MITSVRLINFKNFADEKLKLGPFTVIVGANASGKSNIRDAFRFLHGIARGYTLAEIIGGKYGVGSQLEWEPIRGAPNLLGKSNGSASYSQSPFQLGLDVCYGESVERYTVGVGTKTNPPFEPRLIHEELVDGEEVVFSYMPSLELGTSLRNNSQIPPPKFNFEKPHLLMGRTNYSDTNELPSATFANLASMRFFMFDPERMKLPAVPGSTLGDSGENLPAVLQKICSDPNRKATFTAWIRELTPMDVSDFEFPVDPSGRIYMTIVESSQRKFPAVSVSEGTLRFLGTLAALLTEEPAKLYFFEEIDTGIHPARLPLLVDLIERQTKKRGFQVVTTTHSPDLLSCLGDDSFEHVSVVHRDLEAVDGVIRPISVLPKIRELRSSQGLQVLHGTGWFEDMMEFSDSSEGQEREEP